jgi:RNA polymerase sigma-70 factor (ECF subfamily)
MRTLRRDERTRPGGAVDLHASGTMNATISAGSEATASSRLHEIELMRNAAHGVGAAQRVLATRFVLRVRRAAHAIMGSSPYADDAAQLTLIEILRSAHLYRGDVELDRWVDRIIARSVVSFARAVRRRNPSLDSNRDATVSPSDSYVPRSLDEFLNRLPVVQREVLLLKHALGHGVEEIAEITQASPSTVRERLLSARRDLRRLIRLDHEVSGQRGGTP